MMDAGIGKAATSFGGTVAVEMLGKDSTIKKVTETAGKLGEVGFEKNVTGTVGDNMNGENK
jgi:hypothetical protein